MDNRYDGPISVLANDCTSPHSNTFFDPMSTEGNESIATWVNCHVGRRPDRGHFDVGTSIGGIDGVFYISKSGYGSVPIEASKRYYAESNRPLKILRRGYWKR